MEAQTYSGYTAFQLAAASAPMLAGLLVNLGAKSQQLQLSSDGEESEECQWRILLQQLQQRWGHYHNPFYWIDNIPVWIGQTSASIDW